MRRFARRGVGIVLIAYLGVHGDADSIVPWSLGKRLFEAAPERSSQGLEKRWVTLAGTDHNDVLDVSYREFQAEVRDFLNSIDAHGPAN